MCDSALCAPRAQARSASIRGSSICGYRFVECPCPGRPELGRASSAAALIHIEQEALSECLMENPGYRDVAKWLGACRTPNRLWPALERAVAPLRDHMEHRTPCESTARGSQYPLA